MENIWLESARWVSLPLFALLISIRIAISVALVEIMVRAVAGNLLHLSLTPWINYFAGVCSILLTFLACVEIDPSVVKKHF